MANALIVTLILHVCSSCFHACAYQKTVLKALQWTRARHLQWKTSDLTIHLRMLAYVLYLLYKNVLSLSLIYARPCPMKSWHLCDTSTAAICPLDFSVSQRYVQIKDQGSDIPTQAFSKNCLDIFIAKSGGTRHLQGVTARSGNSFNSNLQNRGRKSKRGGTTRGKHTNHHTDFACLLQLLPRMRLPENFLKALQWTRARHLQWKTSDLTIHLRMLAYALYLLYKHTHLHCLDKFCDFLAPGLRKLS